MSKTYTVHFELTDGTLCDAHFSTDSLRVAREVASAPMSTGPEESGIARIIINKKGMTVAAYLVGAPRKPQGEYRIVATNRAAADYWGAEYIGCK